MLIITFIFDDYKLKSHRKKHHHLFIRQNTEKKIFKHTIRRNLDEFENDDDDDDDGDDGFVFCRSFS